MDETWIAVNDEGQNFWNWIFAWWFIPRIVSELVHPSHKWTTCPHLSHWNHQGCNPLSKWDEPSSRTIRIASLSLGGKLGVAEDSNPNKSRLGVSEHSTTMGFNAKTVFLRMICATCSETSLRTRHFLILTCHCVPKVMMVPGPTLSQWRTILRTSVTVRWVQKDGQFFAHF